MPTIKEKIIKWHKKLLEKYFPIKIEPKKHIKWRK